MTIIRAPRIQRDFLILSNSIACDQALTPRALGVLVRILVKPDNWRTTASDLAAEWGVGRDYMQSAMREIAEAGYLRLIKAQDAAGRWSSQWEVHETPVSTPVLHPEPASPEPAFPEPVDPVSGAPGAGLGVSITRTIEQEPRNKNTPVVPTTGSEKIVVDEVAAGFREFWAQYPNKAGKKAAIKAWNKATQAGRRDIVAEILSALPRHKAQRGWLKDGGEYIPHAATWLNAERWTDEIAVARQSSVDALFDAGEASEAGDVLEAVAEVVA